MQQHYTAISMQAKRRWAVAAWMGAEIPYLSGPGGASVLPSTQGWDTKPMQQPARVGKAS